MELYIEPKRKPYNPTNGRFLKGHVPHNKGRKWEDYMGKRAQKRASKGWKNLEKYRPKERPDTAGRCRKEVIAVDDEGRWYHFNYSGTAAQWIGGSRENVSRCCRCNKERHVNKKTGKVNTDHRYNGVRFYFESDPIWMEKIERKRHTAHGNANPSKGQP